MPWFSNTRPLRARWVSGTTAAFRQFETNKSSAFTCSIFQLYAHSAPNVEWRGFLLRVLALISSLKTPALIRRFIAGL
jgi:hypothetical protein